MRAKRAADRLYRLDVAKYSELYGIRRRLETIPCLTAIFCDWLEANQGLEYGAQSEIRRAVDRNYRAMIAGRSALSCRALVNDGKRA
ncbi:MAG TPA: hypothetical protein VEX68_07895 [Bryobacteraceae bacterium]|nr:hypothetical protein [Bryobacteraceae bacterium]